MGKMNIVQAPFAFYFIIYFFPSGTKEDANFPTKERKPMNVMQSEIWNDSLELFRTTHQWAEQPGSYGILEPLQQRHYQQEMSWPVHGAVHMYNPCSSNHSLIQWKLDIYTHRII